MLENGTNRQVLMLFLRSIHAGIIMTAGQLNFFYDVWGAVLLVHVSMPHNVQANALRYAQVMR